MSLFRKPKKIQRRVFCADDDEDGEPEPPPPPIISHEKKEAKPAKSTPLLSFADEEDEGEVFQVKKSSQSKRLAKRREKEKQKRDVKLDGDNNKYDNNDHEDKNNHTEENEEKPKPKKKVTLEGLILSGREALAADGAGDLSEESAGSDEDSRGFHQYRAESVRAALAGAPGRIPDAALIHAARKTRQQARELGGDYIPVKSESGPGSRLVRDDGSGDDDDEGRLLVRGLDLPNDKPKRGTAAAASDEELGSEADEWEEQQLQKARPAIADYAAGESDVNPFSVVLPAVRLTAAPPHLRPLAEAGVPPPASAQDLVEALRKRLEELQSDRSSTAAKKEELRDRLLNSARVRESRAARCRPLDAAYRRAQAIRGYLTDLIECLDEKMPQLEALEARARLLHKRRCEFLVERRRADVRDQAQDVLVTAAGRAGVKPADSEEKTRRAAEREGRRRARRLQREAAAAAAGAPLRHRDGDSSDDDLPPHEQHHYRHEREAIRQLSSSLFADALPAWRSAAGVCRRLARWRAKAGALYADAYVADCLPKLIAPYVRHQLILWNPLADEDNEDYEKMDWYKCLMMYGVRPDKAEDSSSESASSGDGEMDVTAVTEHGVRSDPDLMLVPNILNRVVLPKLTELVEVSWDPMSVRASVRLRRCVVRAALTPHSGPELRRLNTALRTRLAAALSADVFLPTLPPQIQDSGGGAFWRRCLGAGVRLLRASLALTGPPDLLHADPLVMSLIETLCCGAGAAPGPQAAGAAGALAETVPRAGALRARALRRLAALATLALARLDSDNPLHLKALEQARSVIAEARAID